jgi:hypothetical protein
MTKTLHGKVRGKLIELDEDPGLAEGRRSRSRLERFTRHGVVNPVKVSFALKERWPTTRSGTRSWRRFITSENGILDGKSLNEFPAGHGHLLGSHDASCEIVASVHSVHRSDRNLHGSDA